MLKPHRNPEKVSSLPLPATEIYGWERPWESRSQNEREEELPGAESISLRMASAELDTAAYFPPDGGGGSGRGGDRVV